MTPQAIDAALAQTAADGRVSRGENRALKELFADADPALRALARNRAFALARTLPADTALDWLEEALKAIEPGPAASTGETAAEALFSPGERIRERIVGLLGAARQRIDLCVFTITDDRLTVAIVAALQRGVAVRLVTDDDKQHDLGADIDRLRHAGAEVHTDADANHMHHKFALFDGRTLLAGSYNWTRGATVNCENAIVTADARLVAAFQREFERLWAAFG